MPYSEATKPLWSDPSTAYAVSTKKRRRTSFWLLDSTTDEWSTWLLSLESELTKKLARSEEASPQVFQSDRQRELLRYAHVLRCIQFSRLRLPGIITYLCRPRLRKDRRAVNIQTYVNSYTLRLSLLIPSADMDFRKEAVSGFTAYLRNCYIKQGL